MGLYKHQELGSYSSERLVPATRPHGENTVISPIEGNEEARLLKGRIHEVFNKTNNVYLCFNGKIGDVVLLTSIIEGIHTLGEQTGKPKNVTLLAPKNIRPILEPTAQRYGYEFHALEDGVIHGEDVAKDMVVTRNQHDPLILQFEMNTEYEIYQYVQDFRGGLIVPNLLITAIAGYQTGKVQKSRFGDFFADLIGREVDAQPRVYLPENAEMIKRDFVRDYHLDLSKKQVGLVIEASDEIKRYPLAKWREVIEQIAKMEPNTQFSVLHNGTYNQEELEQAFAIPGINTRLVHEPLNRTSVYMSLLDVAVGNDTGLIHIAANLAMENPPYAISLHHPINSPSLWIGNRKTHQGIVPDERLYEHLYTKDELTNEDIAFVRNLLGEIDASQVANDAVSLLRKRGRR